MNSPITVAVAKIGLKRSLSHKQTVATLSQLPLSSDALPSELGSEHKLAKANYVNLREDQVPCLITCLV